MRNFLKLCVVVAFLLTGVSILVTTTTRATANIVRSDGYAAQRSLYVQNCARCHGANGKAQTTLGRKLEAADLTSADVQGMSSAQITRAIKNGRPDMPAFGKKLTPQQIASLVRYVRSF